MNEEIRIERPDFENDPLEEIERRLQELRNMVYEEINSNTKIN